MNFDFDGQQGVAATFRRSPAQGPGQPQVCSPNPTSPCPGLSYAVEPGAVVSMISASRGSSNWGSQLVLANLQAFGFRNISLTDYGNCTWLATATYSGSSARTIVGSLAGMFVLGLSVNGVVICSASLTPSPTRQPAQRSPYGIAGCGGPDNGPYGCPGGGGCSGCGCGCARCRHYAWTSEMRAVLDSQGLGHHPACPGVVGVGHVECRDVVDEVNMLVFARAPVRQGPCDPCGSADDDVRRADVRWVERVVPGGISGGEGATRGRRWGWGRDTPLQAAFRISTPA